MIFINKGSSPNKQSDQFVDHKVLESYLNFLAENSYLGSKLSLKVIASHIGITPIALSRIRKKLK